MKNIIIDCNNIAYMAFHGLGANLSYDEKPTAVIFGFLNSLLRMQSKLKGDNWIFTWDSKKSYRKKIYPEYKAKRNENKTDEEKEDLINAFKQFKELRKEILPKLGFKNIFLKIGFEADDLIAEVVLNKKYVNDEFIIVSRDKDLYQLLGDRVSILNPKTKNILTNKWFEKEYDMPPFKWGMVKAMGGCSSDNIKGMIGIGEKTAINWYSNDPVIKKGKKYDAIVSKEGFEARMFFKKLTILPFNKRGKYNALFFKDQNLYKKDFIDVFEDYKMMSFLQRKTLDRWIDLFNLK